MPWKSVDDGAESPPHTSRRPRPGRRLALGLVILALLPTGCGTFRRLSYPFHHTYVPLFAENKTFTDHSPQSFTVYPFKNTSWYEEAGARGRQAIHGNFSLIGTCAPLAEIDQRARAPYTAEDALRVAREMDTDAVIIGETLVQDHIFLVLYAYAYAELKIAIYDTQSGRLIWRGSSWSVKGDLAGLSPYTFFIPFGPVIEHFYWSRITADLYNRIAMDIVHKVRPDVIAP
jgi:hypothetical protein